MTTKKKSKIMTWDELKAQTEVDMDLRINLFKEIEKDGTLAVSEKYNVARKRVSCWYGGNKNKIQAEILKRSEENKVSIPATENTEQSSDDVDTLSDWDKLLLRVNEEKNCEEYNTLFGLMDEVDNIGMSTVAGKYNITEDVLRKFLVGHERTNTTNDEPQLKPGDESLSWNDALMDAALDVEAYLNLVDFISCVDNISVAAKKYGISETTINAWFSFNNGKIDSNNLPERVSAIYAVGGVYGESMETYSIEGVNNLLDHWNTSCLELHDALNGMQCDVDVDKLFTNLVCTVSSMGSLPILDDGIFESSSRDDKYNFKHAISEIVKDAMNANEGIQEVSNKVYPNLITTTDDLRRENDVINFIIDTIPQDISYKEIALNADILYGLAYFIEYVNRGVISIEENRICDLIDCSSNSKYVGPILMASALGKMIWCLNLSEKESIVTTFDYPWFLCCRITALPFISTAIAYDMAMLCTRVSVLWAAVKTINSGDIEVYDDRYIKTLIGFSYFTINSLSEDANLPKYTCNEIIGNSVDDFRELLCGGCIDYDTTMFSFDYNCSVCGSHNRIDYVSMIMLSQYCRYITVVYSNSRNICSTGVFERRCMNTDGPISNDIGVAVHTVWITLLKTLCTVYLRMAPFDINEKSAAWDIFNLDRMIFSTNIHDFNTTVNLSPCKIKFIRKLSKLPHHIAEKWILNLCLLVYSDLPMTTIARIRIELILEIINKLGHKEMMHPNKSVDKVLKIIEKMN